MHTMPTQTKNANKIARLGSLFGPLSLAKKYMAG